MNINYLNVLPRYFSIKKAYKINSVLKLKYNISEINTKLEYSEIIKIFNEDKLEKTYYFVNKRFRPKIYEQKMSKTYFYYKNFYKKGNQINNYNFMEQEILKYTKNKNYLIFDKKMITFLYKKLQDENEKISIKLQNENEKIKIINNQNELLKHINKINKKEKCNFAIDEDINIDEEKISFIKNDEELFFDVFRKCKLLIELKNIFISTYSNIKIYISFNQRKGDISILDERDFKLRFKYDLFDLEDLIFSDLDLSDFISDSIKCNEKEEELFIDLILDIFSDYNINIDDYYSLRFKIKND